MPKTKTPAEQRAELQRELEENDKKIEALEHKQEQLDHQMTRAKKTLSYIDSNSAINQNDRQLLSEFLTQYHRQNVSSGDTPFNRRYILDYSVTNGGVFKLPRTGSNGN